MKNGNNVNQETEEKKVESTEMVDKEKAKKMDEVFNTTSDIVLSDIAKIVGRELTDDEKKKLGDSLKAYFVMTSLMMGCACK